MAKRLKRLAADFALSMAGMWLIVYGWEQRDQDGITVAAVAYGTSGYLFITCAARLGYRKEPTP